MKLANYKIRYVCKGARILSLLLLLLQCLAFRAQVSVEMTNGINVVLNGETQLHLTGNWLNAGSLVPGSSQLYLEGFSNQLLQQNQGAFFGLSINKASGQVILSSDILLVKDTLKISAGSLELNGYKVELDSTATLSESAGSTAKGASGHLTTTRLVNAPVGENIAGMGLVLSSLDNYGETEVRRGHAPQSTNGLEGISRYFEVFPQFQGSNPVLLEFLYDESELNANLEGALKLYASRDSGRSWQEVSGTLDTAANRFTATVTDTFNRFTLSSNSLIGLPDLAGVFSGGPCGLQLEVAPNPFYYETEIRFKLPESGYLEFTVYDLTGRPVAHLAKGNYGTEWQEMAFGGNYAKGVYIFHLQTACGSVARRVILQ